MAHREFFLRLAASGLRMPIGADLILHEERDPDEVRRDGRRLGEVIERAARLFRTPLAVPLMDLRLEKADLLGRLGIAAADIGAFHFTDPPAEEALAALEAAFHAPFDERSQAHIDSIRYIAERTDLFPIGMVIGPFSLMTKLLADPILAIAMAGMGLSSNDDPGVMLAERSLALAEAAIARSLAAQVAARAKAVIVCEPAANVVYLSPKQIEAGSDIFERFVILPNLRLKRRLEEAGAALIFHDCGQVNDHMVREFARRLDPAILSLGNSRKLWRDAALVPGHIVLFGNLPTRTFYSDTDMPAAKVEELTCDLMARMRQTGHPFILGSECDVLSVPGAHETIRRKVDVMLNCPCC